MNWDFAAILKFSKSGTNRRLWDRSVSDTVPKLRSAVMFMFTLVAWQRGSVYCW